MTKVLVKVKTKPKPVRLRRRVVRKPRCLCQRSLGENILHTNNFTVVTCSKGFLCSSPKYLHSACARFYKNILRRCPGCQGKLVVKKTKVSLRESLRRQREQMHV